MDIETIFGAAGVSVVILVFLLIGGAAIIYSIVKRKKDYKSTGIPELRYDPKEKEGSSDKK